MNLQKTTLLRLFSLSVQSAAAPKMATAGQIAKFSNLPELKMSEHLRG
jgi:hypothetical protein